MRRLAVPLLAIFAIVAAGCRNRHVNGTNLRPPQACTGSWIARVDNVTNRYYDLYVGSRVVGTAEPRSTNRIVIDPALGHVTPQLRESLTTRDETGPRLSPAALRMACE